MDNKRPRKIGSHNGARYNILASQTEILDRIKELKVSSHGGMTRALLWWRVMIWLYEGPCKIATHLDMPSLYFLHNHFPQTGTLENHN